MRIGTRGSALALAQAGAVSRALGPGRARHHHDDRRPRPRGARQGALGARARRARCCAARSTSRCTPPRTCPASCADGIVDRRGAAARAAPWTRSAAPRRSTRCPPARASGRASLRRTAQLRALRDGPRGARAARQRRHAAARGWHAGDYDAIVLARAGLERLSRERRGDRHASPSSSRAPARARWRSPRAPATTRALAAARALDDAPTHACLRAERALVRALDADCHTPVGAHATLDDAGAMTLARVRRPPRRLRLAARRAPVAGARRRTRRRSAPAVGERAARGRRADEVLGR